MMFDFLKKKEKKASNDDNKFIMSAALLIHAAKIDQNFTEKEKTIIKKTLVEIYTMKQRKLKIIQTKFLILQGRLKI